MVYRNFFFRAIFSFFLISIYLTINFINFELVYYLILVIYFLIFIEIIYYFKEYKIIPSIYVFISFIFFYIIDFNEEMYLNFNLYIFSVASFDIFSYLIGKLFGSHKLIRISPNKTIEGFFGGFLISIFLSFCLAFFLGMDLGIYLVLFIVTIILSSFLGDIIESYFKRKNNLKNSSELIPGHGGVFDRFDSFLFSIIFYSIFIFI